MQTDTLKKNRVITLASLAFLFCTRWMLYRLERNTELNIPCFAAECALFLLVFGLCVFRAPLPVPFITLLAGCAALGVLYALTDDVHTGAFLLPAAFFPAFLFLIDQQPQAKNANRQLPLKTLYTGVMFVYPWVEAGIVLYALIVGKAAFSAAAVCCVLLSALLAAVYGLIARMPAKKGNKTAKQDKHDENRRVRSAFLFAVISIPATCLFPVLTGNIIAAQTLLLLWAADLPLLYAQGHPQICAFADRLPQANWLSS